MTKALEEAFKKASKLPPSKQDALAAAILGEIHWIGSHAKYDRLVSQIRSG